MRFGFLMPLAADVEVRGGQFAWDWEVPTLPGGVTRAPISFT
jgi:hypothetical protein